jgi:hypothetical protein
MQRNLQVIWAIININSFQCHILELNLLHRAKANRKHGLIHLGEPDVSYHRIQVRVANQVPLDSACRIRKLTARMNVRPSLSVKATAGDRCHAR